MFPLLELAITQILKCQWFSKLAAYQNHLVTILHVHVGWIFVVRNVDFKQIFIMFSIIMQIVWQIYSILSSVFAHFYIRILLTLLYYIHYFRLFLRISLGIIVFIMDLDKVENNKSEYLLNISWINVLLSSELKVEYLFLFNLFLLWRWGYPKKFKCFQEDISRNSTQYLVQC